MVDVHADWIKRFIQFKQRGVNNRGGRVPKDSSLAYYAWMLSRVEQASLDLEHCTDVQLNEFLDKYQRGRSVNSYSDMVGLIKQVLAFFERHDLNARIKIPARPDPTERIKDQTISDEDVTKLIKGAPTLRDRLLIELLSELGSRRGEIYNLRIKDVAFDKYSAILTLTGKSGTRLRRVYSAVADLRTYINNHPHRDDPLAPLLLTESGKPLTTPQSVYGVVRRLSMKVLKRPIHPHQFRHARATKDSSYFTDREMMKLYGWRKTDMISVYSHISMKDVDDKDLVLHGLKSKAEILRPIVDVMKCASCEAENAPFSVYCQKCGKVLSKESTREAIQEEVRRILKEQGAELLKELAKSA
jgi:integrase